MSLINQMLQDLETRHADSAARAALPGDVRPLPSERRTPWVRAAIGAFAAGLLAAAAVLWFRAQETAPAAPNSVASVPPAANAGPGASVSVQSSAPAVTQPITQPPAQPITQPAAEAVVQPPPPAAPTPVAEALIALPVAKESKIVATEPRPRAAAVLARQAETRPEASLKVATALSAPVANADGERQPHAVSRPPIAAPAKDPSKGQGPPSIEKQARQAAPHDRAEAEYRRAAGLLNQGRQDAAIAALRAALQEEPGHANARLTLFAVFVEQRKLDEAQALLQEGMAQNPQQPQLATRLARIQIERGDVGGAAATLALAAGGASGNADYRAFHAAVLQRLNRHAEAAGEYQAALRLAPQAGGVWWMGLGISLEAEGKSAEARDAFQRARASGTLTAELLAFVDQKLRQIK